MTDHGARLGDRVEVLTGPFRREVGEVVALIGESSAEVELEEGTRIVEDRANLAAL